MICPHCGKEANFKLRCNHCGGRLVGNHEGPLNGRIFSENDQEIWVSLDGKWFNRTIDLVSPVPGGWMEFDQDDDAPIRQWEKEVTLDRIFDGTYFSYFKKRDSV